MFEKGKLPKKNRIMQNKNLETSEHYRINSKFDFNKRDNNKKWLINKVTSDKTSKIKEIYWILELE